MITSRVIKYLFTDNVSLIILTTIISMIYVEINPIRLLSMISLGIIYTVYFIFGVLLPPLAIGAGTLILIQHIGSKLGFSNI